ncbi:MAG: UDP-N-acetylglucosamine pyrophosphorylase [Candidatus Zixiibacteriota bacterium]|nr:MAG: UDP-N-acetylglucosamine pyrophosphorylase [candidate division Zixibacteria bacterium]
MSEKRAAIILAAGKGKRMKSDLPKVLHQISGRPMIEFLLDTLISIGLDKTIVVIGYKGELVQQALSRYPVEFAWQREQLGTGHAVQMTANQLADFEGTTLVAAGDVPYLSKQSITILFETHQKVGAAATCLSAIFDDPTGYGRVIREGNSDILREIVEHKDASAEVLAINEINSGTFCFDNKELFAALQEVNSNNTQGEYYLTDTVKIMHNKGLRVGVVTCENADEVRGVNSIDQLKELERKIQQK